ncbi:MAG: hypothetical protein K8R36_24190 [Planctomycetales bacterium]|nr:hypothetical protein [Planctomycetales bacterium]
MDECLVYFRLAVTDPRSVPPWSEWWGTNETLASEVFSFADYVRLKHRRLLGARQILQRLGEIPGDFMPPSHQLTGSCGNCGERTINQDADSGEVVIICPNCGSLG